MTDSLTAGNREMDLILAPDISSAYEADAADIAAIAQAKTWADLQLIWPVIIARLKEFPSAEVAMALSNRARELRPQE